MSAPIRILHTESSRSIGGQELRILLEMEKLKELGFESVLAARSGSLLLDEAKQCGLRAFAIPMHNRLDPVSMAMLWRLMRRERIDVVNAHGSRDAWLAFPVARLLGIGTIRSRHVANPIRRHRLGQLVYGPLCDRVITTSESIRRGLIECGIAQEKIVSIPTGVDVAKFSSANRTGKLRRKLGIPSDAPLVGMISILRSDKGPDVFLETCSRVMAARSNLWCVLVGDGWMRPQLENLHANLPHRERIVLAGFQRDIPEVLAELDLSVVPTRIPEGIPQTLLQSHAARVPVVATTVPGVEEVAAEGDTAFTAPPNDPGALAAAIGRALDNRQQAERQAARGHALVVARYSIEAMLAEMAAVYHGLAKGARR